VSDSSPTRAAVLELKDEQRAMHEGYVFLDEKCLLLAGEILRQLARHAELEDSLRAAHQTAMNALQAALARHGLQGLQVQPAAGQETAVLKRTTRSLMGVRLQDAGWTPADEPAAPAVNPSPEARACRQAFVALMAATAPLAAVTGNLVRLSQEYRRSVRRARALQDVLLPELGRSIHGIETRLEELEQEEAVLMRRRA
jgi:V/A-type H+-transporting ATPase subunit D